MNVLNLIGQIFGPAADLIDNLHTSDEEKLTAKNGLMSIQASVVGQAVEMETTLINAKRDIIVAEAKSDSWLTRNMRPLVVSMFSLAVMAYWFGLTPTDPITGLSTIPLSIVQDMYMVVKIGLGGYITSRGVEKIAPAVAGAFKRKEKT